MWFPITTESNKKSTTEQQQGIHQTFENQAAHFQAIMELCIIVMKDIRL